MAQKKETPESPFGSLWLTASRLCVMDGEFQSGVESKKEKEKGGKSEEKRWGEHQFGSSSGPKEEIACFSLFVTDSRTINLITWRKWD